MLKGLPIRGKPVDWCDYDLPANKVLQTFPRSSSWDDLGAPPGLTTVPSLSKRKSSKTDRMSKFIVGMKEVDNEYYVEISPILDGRIKVLHGV
jgi:hypothetical protein